MSYLTILKEAKARMMTEREHATTPPVDVVEPSPTLAAAYRRYWSTPEDDATSMEVFRDIYKEIVTLEAQIDPAVAWATLRAAATAWHKETGVCPFCRQPGELHLPADRLEDELRHR